MCGKWQLCWAGMVWFCFPFVGTIMFGCRGEACDAVSERLSVCCMQRYCEKAPWLLPLVSPP